MPDLPSRVPAPTFTPDAYDETRALGSRRRRRQATWVGGGSGAVAALVTAVVLAQSAAPGDRALLIPGDPIPTTSESAQPGPTPTPTPTRGGLVPQLPPLPVGLPAPTPTLTGPPTAPPEGTPAPSGPSSPEPGELTTGPKPTRTTYDPTKGCNGSGPVGFGWCSYYDGDLTAVHGSTAELAGAVCRMTGQPAGTLRSDDGEFASFFAATQDNLLLWDWSHGRAFAKTPASFDVAAGTCLRFAVTWDLTGNDGKALPVGSYSADARPAVADSSANRANVSGGITFTIT